MEIVTTMNDKGTDVNIQNCWQGGVNFHKQLTESIRLMNSIQIFHHASSSPLLNLTLHTHLA